METIEKKYDVLVCGGGMAGVCAALASARHGARTALVQDRPVLGGNSSSEIRVHIMGADHNMVNPNRRETGIIEELLLENWVTNPAESYAIWDQVLYNKVFSQPNLDLYLNTAIHGAVMEGNRIVAALAIRNRTEQVFRFSARMFIDASGDGRLGYEAGAHFAFGRESRDTYGEDLAPLKADGWVMGDSILFWAKDMGHPVPYTPPEWAIRYESEEQLPYRRINSPAHGYWWVEVGRENTQIRDGEAIRHDVLAHVFGLWALIKKRPDAANHALEWVGSLPGRRDSRRFIGEHVLTQSEVQNPPLFEDRVAFGGWPIDLHPPGGITNPDPPFFHIRLPQAYSIPLRSLYSRNIENLFFAGRNASMSHVAMSSTRVQSTGAVMGQAAGTAAAFAVKHDCTPRAVAHDHILKLRQIMLRDDASILLAPNEDPEDLARKAHVTADSAKPDAPPEKILDGLTRNEENLGHYWESEGLPCWIELDLGGEVSLSSVEFKFDSNLSRTFVITPYNELRNRQISGPPPELPKIYRIEIPDGEGWKTIHHETGNFFRHRRHPISGIRTRKIRLTVEETWGAETFRLFECRVYG